jgi:hypothetical protein
MKHLVLGLVASICVLPIAGAQTAPAQPQDPTMQAPATAPNSGTPRTVPNAKRVPDEAQNPSKVESSSTSATHAKPRPLMGTVVHQGKDYMLRAGDLDVKVTGNLDRQSNTIHVQEIEASPAI